VTEDYSQAIQQVSVILVDEVLSVEKERLMRPLELDAMMREVLRRVGLCIMQQVLEAVAAEVTAQAEANDPGLVVQRRPLITVDSVFGTVSVESPYLWHPGASARPVQTELGLSHRQRSLAVERALTDFGAEESFGQAAKRFEEHYGWAIGRTNVLEVAERRAVEAESYVAERLARESAAFDQPLGVRPGVDEMLVELDGCEIRTGTLVLANSDEKTPVRQRPKRKRIEEWRDVRVGLARRLDEVDPSYVARMAGYPEVVGQLFQAAVGRGLSSRTTTVAVADGGNGLREELGVQFPNLHFIYDRPHLNGHLYETAEAMGLDADAREAWVERIGASVDGGGILDVLRELRSHRGRGKRRVVKLFKHLSRLSDAVHYAEYRARGWPTGSGEVESAHRSIPQKRLKLPGASWGPSTVNPMLALRIIRANDWWGDFWRQKRELMEEAA
jgi:hypothetical protein